MLRIYNVERRQKWGEKRKEGRIGEEGRLGEAQGNTMNTWINRTGTNVTNFDKKTTSRSFVTNFLL